MFAAGDDFEMLASALEAFDQILRIQPIQKRILTWNFLTPTPNLHISLAKELEKVNKRTIEECGKC